MSQITMTKTHPGGTAGVLEMGKTYTVGTDLSATLADALVRQGKAVTAGESWATPTPATSLTIGGPQRLPVIGGVFIDGESGAIIDASTLRPVSSKIGKTSLYFNGSTSKITVPTALIAPRIDGAKQLTVGGFAKLTDYSTVTTRHILAFPYLSGGAFLIQHGVPGAGQFNLTGTSRGVYQGLSQSTTLTRTGDLTYNGGWHFVCAKHDYERGNCKVYLDGILVATNASPNWGVTAFNAASLGANGFIGIDASGTAQAFSGNLKGIFIHTADFADTDIFDMARSGIIPSASLVEAWDFDEMTGTTVTGRVLGVVGTLGGTTLPAWSADVPTR